MGKQTNIEWCDSTINPTSGCAGCELWKPGKRTCYAGILQTTRLSKSLPALYSPRFTDVRLIPGRMAQAAGWSDLRGAERPGKPWLNGMPRTIFVGDMGDFLSHSVPDDYIKREVIDTIASKKGSRHFYFLLTKRAHRLARLSHDLGGLPDNCMAMTTITDQLTANVRIAHLLDVKCRWHGISAEPLLGPVSLSPLKIPADEHSDDFLYWPLTGQHLRNGMNEPVALPNATRLDWVITGGESGSDCTYEGRSEPTHPDWVRSIALQCKDANVPHFFKQWGNWIPGTIHRDPEWANGAYIETDNGQKTAVNDLRVHRWSGIQASLNMGSKTASGRLLDGAEHNGFPNLLA